MNNILNNEIETILNSGISRGKFKILSKADIPLIEQILSNYKLNKNGTNNPEMIFVAAPTGAGKDTLVRKITSQNPEKNFIILNMDMFRHYSDSISSKSEKLNDKNFAKKTNEVSYEIYYLIEELILKFYNQTNIILTGTIKDTDWIESVFKKYKNSNYMVTLDALPVPYSESAISIFERYLNTVKTQLSSKKHDTSPIRYTALKYHDSSFNGFNNSFKHFEEIFKENPGELLDKIQVFKRDKSIHDLSQDTLIYSSDNNNPITATEIVNSILFKKDHKIDPKRISDLLGIISDYSEYLKTQGIYFEILESIQKINNLNKEVLAPKTSDINDSNPISPKDDGPDFN